MGFSQAIQGSASVAPEQFVRFRQHLDPVCLVRLEMELVDSAIGAWTDSGTTARPAQGAGTAAAAEATQREALPTSRQNQDE